MSAAPPRVCRGDDHLLWSVTMTWLPIAVDALPERDAVLGLKPELYTHLRETLAAAWRIVDPRLLDCCRLRMAQMMGARAELAGADPQLLAELKQWQSSPAFSERERVALAYAEQYHLDHTLITDEQKQELARHFSRRGAINFVWALWANETYARILTLFDIAPDPPSAGVRPERNPAIDPADRRDAAINTMSDPDSADMWALRDREFSDAHFALGRGAVAQKLIDDVTSEAVRLHNANHQGCLY